MQKNVAGQKWCVFAFNLTDNIPKSGDALNITANLRIDGGAANAVDDINPTELEDGFYAFDLTQVESSGDMILISPQSSTADIQVIGVPGVVYTTAPNINKLGIEADGDLTKVNLCEANTDMRGTDAANVLIQMNAALDTAIAELSQAIPSATPTLRTAVMLLYMAMRNKIDVTASTKEIHNDAGTQIAVKTTSDDDVTYTETKMAAGS